MKSGSNTRGIAIQDVERPAHPTLFLMLVATMNTACPYASEASECDWHVYCTAMHRRSQGRRHSLSDPISVCGGL